MTAAAATAQPIEDRHAEHIEQIAALLPVGARQTLLKIVDLLQQSNIQVDEVVGSLLHLGESLIERGLDASIETIERLVELLYEAGIMYRLGTLNPFLRDGAEMGIQVGLNALKAMTPTDVAKLTALILVIAIAPNLLILNGAAYLAIAAELLEKLWHLP